MKKIYGLKEWKLDKNVPENERLVHVSISLIYPDPKQFIDFKPKDRIKQIDDHHKADLKKLTDLNLFAEYEVTGTKKRPTGVKTKVNYTDLQKLDAIDFIESVHIKLVEKAKQIKAKASKNRRYFCVKMTVVIDFEGVSQKSKKLKNVLF